MDRRVRAPFTASLHIHCSWCIAEALTGQLPRPGVCVWGVIDAAKGPVGGQCVASKWTCRAQARPEFCLGHRRASDREIGRLPASPNWQEAGLPRGKCGKGEDATSCGSADLVRSAHGVVTNLVVAVLSVELQRTQRSGHGFVRACCRNRASMIESGHTRFDFCNDSPLRVFVHGRKGKLHDMTVPEMRVKPSVRGVGRCDGNATVWAESGERDVTFGSAGMPH
eukprot:3627411-Pleurochrysis_carterae.AAC.1